MDLGTRVLIFFATEWGGNERLELALGVVPHFLCARRSGLSGLYSIELLHYGWCFIIQQYQANRGLIVLTGHTRLARGR